MSKPTSIDNDPEFFHGLTFWGEKVSAQVREASSAEEYLTGLVVHPLGTPEGEEVFLPMPDARRLRDLLNVATARGFL